MQKTVTFTYGKIPGYRDPSRQSWGFLISDPAAHYDCGQYTCARRSAKRIYQKLKETAEAHGYTALLVVTPGCGLNQDLTLA